MLVHISGIKSLLQTYPLWAFCDFTVFIECNSNLMACKGHTYNATKIYDNSIQLSIFAI